MSLDLPELEESAIAEVLKSANCTGNETINYTEFLAATINI
jgi:hypothetical protein